MVPLAEDIAVPVEVARWLGRHPTTFSKWLHHFNAAGLDRLADLPGRVHRGA